VSWGAMPGTPAATAYGLKHLPHDLLGQRIALHPAAAVDGLENVAIHHVGGTGRGIDGDFDPGGHGHGPNAPVLADQVHDAAPPIAPLNVGHPSCEVPALPAAGTATQYFFQQVDHQVGHSQPHSSSTGAERQSHARNRELRVMASGR